MDTLLLIIVMIVSLAAAFYTHWRLPYHTPNARQLRIARIVLISTGLAFGWIAARVYGMATELNVVLVFIAALGLIHVPAAGVLFIKSFRPGE
jgi:predicted Na+-dependent transporter